MKKNILIAIFLILSLLIPGYFLGQGNFLVGLTGIVWILGILAIAVGPFILFTVVVARIVRKLDPKVEIKNKA
jgi:hypothetical protein